MNQDDIERFLNTAKAAAQQRARERVGSLLHALGDAVENPQPRRTPQAPETSVILKCQSCGQRNRVHSNRSGAPRCAKCKEPLIVGVGA